MAPRVNGQRAASYTLGGVRKKEHRTRQGVREKEHRTWRDKALDNMIKRRKTPKALLATSPTSHGDRDSPMGTSPLLNLTAELRNLIYSFVLGGKTIHVEGSSPNTEPRELRAAQRFRLSVHELHDLDQGLSMRQARSDLYTFHHFDVFPHDACTAPRNDAANDSLDLQLLLICRQVYREAALIPYLENQFWFSNIVILQAFMEFLCPAQVEAVCDIAIKWSWFNSDPTFERRLGQKMTGVRCLTIAVRSTWFYYLDDIKQQILHLKSLPIEKIHVLYGGNRSLSEDDSRLSQWTESLAQQLVCAKSERIEM